MLDQAEEGEVVGDPGPVAIGAAATIANAYSGPHTCIGDEAVVQGAEIEDSVVLSRAEIQHIAEPLQHGAVGREQGSSVSSNCPKAYPLVVGKDAEIARA